MSMLIKGMKMPTEGKVMTIYKLKGEFYASLNGTELFGGFADWYIQESPMYLGDNKVAAETIGDAMKAIETAPVVIPAERSEE